MHVANAAYPVRSWHCCVRCPVRCDICVLKLSHQLHSLLTTAISGSINNSVLRTLMAVTSRHGIALHVQSHIAINATSSHLVKLATAWWLQHPPCLSLVPATDSCQNTTSYVAEGDTPITMSRCMQRMAYNRGQRGMIRLAILLVSLVSLIPSLLGVILVVVIQKYVSPMPCMLWAFAACALVGHWLHVL
jgi:hypothetical protein